VTRSDRTRVPARWPAAMLLAILLLALGPQPAGAAGEAEILAQRGFGDRQNGYAWSMAWFKGRLYVGTGRNIYCVESLTTEYYFPVAETYKPHPLPNVRCPKDPWNLDLRAEIWQYTPWTGRWRRVYRSPRDIRNPRARGRFLARDIAFRGMGVARDRRGRPALFVSGVTSDEYVPELAKKHPPRLLRTRDGIHFHDVGAPGIIRRNGAFASHRPIGFRGLQVWRGRLFVSASAGLMGDGAIFRVDRPFARRARFRQISPPSLSVFEFTTFNDALYAGAGDADTGYSVWKTGQVHRTFDCSSPTCSHGWKPVVTNGAGRGRKITSVLSMESFRGGLFVGSVGWASLVSGEEAFPTAEIIRIRRDDKWDVVVGNPRPGPDGRTRHPLSGLHDGFENVFNAHFWRMLRTGGALYVGTLDWSYLVQTNKQWGGIYSGVLSSLLAGELGYDVWATCNGADWFPVTRNAFDGDMYGFGARTMVPDHRGGFLVGTANHANGTTIVHEPVPACSSLIDRKRRLRDPSAATVARAPRPPASGAAPAAPRAMLTDVQPEGTVVSWEPSPGASRYVVMRADAQPVSMSFVAPPALPNGLRFDDQVPIPVAPGTPGSYQATLPILPPFTPAGTTSATHFVDRTAPEGKRHAYVVVAETASNRRSPASNMQVVPDPRPRATFAQLEQALPMARAATSGRLARRWRRGDKAGTLAELARLRRGASTEEARRLAYRLARRLQYADVAGGP
jgi:hypothetical protein